MLFHALQTPSKLPKLFENSNIEEKRKRWFDISEKLSFDGTEYFDPGPLSMRLTRSYVQIKTGKIDFQLFPVQYSGRYKFPNIRTRSSIWRREEYPIILLLNNMPRRNDF